MRITDGIRTMQATGNMQAADAAIQRLQQQVSSGLRVQRPSEDPGAAASIMEIRSELKATAQFQRNISQAVARVETEEMVLAQLDDALSRALELAVGQADDLANASTRQQVRAEVESLLQFAVSLGNTRWGDGYLFGGFAAAQPPFDPADPLRPHTPAELALIDRPHLVPVGPRQQAASNHNAIDIFVQTGALDALAGLSAALDAGTGAAVRDAIEPLRSALSGVQQLVGEVGGRHNQLTATDDALRFAALSATRLRSELEDTDMTDALVRLAARQGVLQAAFMSTSRIMSMNLLDYLR